MKKSTIFLALISYGISFSQGISTDRPDQTEASNTLNKGNFQIESGLLFGLVAFGGVGCQFGVDILNRDVSCDDALFPAFGAGVSYMLKEEASLLIRLEFAKGKSDNEAVYLRFGHSF